MSGRRKRRDELTVLSSFFEISPSPQVDLYPPQAPPLSFPFFHSYTTLASHVLLRESLFFRLPSIQLAFSAHLRLRAHLLLLPSFSFSLFPNPPPPSIAPFPSLSTTSSTHFLGRRPNPHSRIHSHPPLLRLVHRLRFWNHLANPHSDQVPRFSCRRHSDHSWNLGELVLFRDRWEGHERG